MQLNHRLHLYVLLCITCNNEMKCTLKRTLKCNDAGQFSQVCTVSCRCDSAMSCWCIFFFNWQKMNISMSATHDQTTRNIPGLSTHTVQLIYRPTACHFQCQKKRKDSVCHYILWSTREPDYSVKSLLKQSNHHVQSDHQCLKLLTLVPLLKNTESG